MSNRIVEMAKIYLGFKYVWGGESVLEGGFDCSGYIFNVLNDSGIKVARTTAQGYYNMFSKNTASKNSEGALLFFGKSTSNITHVAINVGDGKHMYESIGNKSNTKKNPGKGVTLSLISRRKDLVAICLPYKVSKPSLGNIKIPKPTLRQGNRGMDVEHLQTFLKLNNPRCDIKCDGIFGPNTKYWVMMFQYNNGLVNDGIYGPHTYNKARQLAGV